MMPVAQFQVTEEGGAYLCIARALVFEGSVLVYNPTMNEAEWVPVCGLTNDLTWAEERSTMALANYVLHIPVEAAQITRLRAHQIVSCPDDSSTSEEEEVQHPELQTMYTEPEQEEENEDDPDRLTGRKKQSQTDSNAHETGKRSWKGWRDWHMITHGQTPMQQSWGWTACRGLHYPCVARPLTPHLTLQGMWP